MKFALLLFSFSFSAASSFAQVTHTYSAIPSTTNIVSTSDLQDVTKFDIYFKNTTGKDINVSWRKISLDLPDGWDFSLCDLGTCYAGIPDGDHTMFPIEKDSSGFLAPNIYPGGITGTGKIIMYVWDKDHPSVNDTL